MNRPLLLFTCAAAAVLISGCTPGRSLSRSELLGNQPIALSVMANKPSGPMPLIVGDSLGISVFTTRKALVARGHIDPARDRFATGETLAP